MEPSSAKREPLSQSLPTTPAADTITTTKKTRAFSSPSSRRLASSSSSSPSSRRLASSSSSSSSPSPQHLAFVPASGASMPRNNQNLALERMPYHHHLPTTLPPGDIPPQSPSAAYEHRALPPVPRRPPRPPQGLGLDAPSPRMSWQSDDDAAEAVLTRQKRFASVDESRQHTQNPHAADIAHPVPRKSPDKILKLTGVSLGHDVVSSPRQATPPLLYRSSQKTKQLTGAGVAPSKPVPPTGAMPGHLAPDGLSGVAAPSMPLPKSHRRSVGHRRSMPEQRAREQTPDSVISRLSADEPIMSQPSTCSSASFLDAPPSSPSPLQQSQRPPREDHDVVPPIGPHSQELADVSPSSSPSATSSVYSDDDDSNAFDGGIAIPGPLVGSPAPGALHKVARKRPRNTGPDPLIKEFDLFARDLDRYDQGTVHGQSAYDYASYEQSAFGQASCSFPDEHHRSSASAYAAMFSHPPARISTDMYHQAHTKPLRHSGVSTTASASTLDSLAAGQASDHGSMRSSLENRRRILHELAFAGTSPPQLQRELHGSNPAPYSRDDADADADYGDADDDDDDGEEEEDMLDLYHATAKEAAKEEAAERASREATVAAAAEAALCSKKSRKGLKGLSTRILQGTLPRGLAPLTPPPPPLGDGSKTERQATQTADEQQVSMFEMDDDDDEGSSYLSRVLRWPTSSVAGGERDKRDDDHAKRFPGSSSTASSHSQPRDGALSGLMSSALKSAGLHNKKNRRRADMRGKIRVIPEGSSL